MNDENFKAAVVHMFKESDERMARMETALDENTAKTDAVHDSTKELVEVLQTMKGGFKVMEWLAKMGKIIAGIAAGAVVVAKMMGWKWPWNP